MENEMPNEKRKIRGNNIKIKSAPPEEPKRNCY